MITHRTNNPKLSPLIDRSTVQAQAKLLLSKERFTHEDSARVNGLLSLAATLPPPSSRASDFRVSAESAALDKWLRYSWRTLGIGSPTQTTATSDLAQQGFYDRLIVALKMFDQIFSDRFVSLTETVTGSPLAVPSLDDTANPAVAVDENQQEGAADPVLSSKVLGVPKCYRSQLLRVSRELLDDTAFDLVSFLAIAFGIRFSRGAGPDLVAALIADAKVGATATGSSANTGGAETGATSIGWGDLIALRKSVNPAYRQTEKCSWYLNDNTLSDLDGLLDKSGRPFIVPEYDVNGNRLLLGYPVCLCPSMDDVAASAKPIAFGAGEFFLVRAVAQGTRVRVLNEAFAEYGQIAFTAEMRVNGALLAAGGSDSPIKVLQNAA